MKEEKDKMTGGDGQSGGTTWRRSARDLPGREEVEVEEVEEVHMRGSGVL